MVNDCLLIWKVKINPMVELASRQRWKYDNMDPIDPLIWIGEISCLTKPQDSPVWTDGNLKIIQIIAGKIPPNGAGIGVVGKVSPKGRGMDNQYMTYPACVWHGKPIEQYSIFFFNDLYVMKDGKPLFTYLEGQDAP